MHKKKLAIFDFDDLIYGDGRGFKDFEVPVCYLVYKKLFTRLIDEYRLLILSKEHTSYLFLWVRFNKLDSFFEAPIKQRRKSEIYLNKDNINIFIRNI